MKSGPISPRSEPPSVFLRHKQLAQEYLDRWLATAPGLGIALVFITSYVAWDQLTRTDRVEALQRAYAEQEARREHISELIQQYRGAGQKPPPSDGEQASS